MINVTKPAKPPLDEYLKYLAGIWDRGHFTNHGPLCLELEERVQKYLEATHFHYVSNGTLALQLALKSLGRIGEVITTPFSFVATSSSIVWEGFKPVFVDIEPDYLTINPDRIEEAITDKTVAILATHVFGNPCDVEKIQKLAEKHHLSVIYDGAHAFGTHYKNKPLSCYGDITALSFHATKLFHTVEGGGIVTADATTSAKIVNMRNFGLDGPETVTGVGINAKNCELHAAMGLCNLPHVKSSIQRRRYIFDLYEHYLISTTYRVSRPLIRENTDYNYAYYPVLFDSEKLLLQAKDLLNKEEINPRRYFYPSLNTVCYLEGQKMSISEDISRRVLCLPLFDEMTESLIERICQIIYPALMREAA